MATRFDGRIAAAIALAFLVCGVGSVAASVRADSAHATRFLSRTGESLPDTYRPRPRATTYFVIHGFQATGREEPSIRLAGAIATRFPNANVIVVDWGAAPMQETKSEVVWTKLFDLAAQYQQSAERARQVGKHIALWMKKQGILPKDTVLCGHSLGAQIAAFASNECAKPACFGRRVRGILAADPAGPLFSGNAPEHRLDEEDADDVIVIHATECLGDHNPIGTVDLYIQWPESDSTDFRRRHSEARELLTQSFHQPGMANADGSPFGANILTIPSARGRSFAVLWDGASQQARARATYRVADLPGLQRTSAASQPHRTTLAAIPRE